MRWVSTTFTKDTFAMTGSSRGGPRRAALCFEFGFWNVIILRLARKASALRPLPDIKRHHSWPRRRLLRQPKTLALPYKVELGDSSSARFKVHTHRLVPRTQKSVHKASNSSRFDTISQKRLIRFSLIFPCGKSSYCSVKRPGQIPNPGAVRSTRVGPFNRVTASYRS